MITNTNNTHTTTTTTTTNDSHTNTNTTNHRKHNNTTKQQLPRPAESPRSPSHVQGCFAAGVIGGTKKLVCKNQGELR